MQAAFIEHDWVSMWILHTGNDCHCGATARTKREPIAR
jgi:hypothetical protein